MKKSYATPLTLCALLPEGLGAYLFQDILPRYGAFDPAHRQDHALAVLRRSLQLARQFDVETPMVCVVALFHDLGLAEGRERHHLVSADIIRHDRLLPQWFTPQQIEVMAQAAEDHRASADHAPRSLYGCIVAEADRLIEPDLIMRRTMQYSRAHYPHLDEAGHLERCLQHLQEKYGPQGYLRLWIPGSENERRLHELWDLMQDGDALRRRLMELWEETAP